MLLPLIVVLSCANNGPTGPTGPYAFVNQWIYDEMDLYYFWQETIPEPSAVDGEQLPERWFDQLTRSDDSFSYMSSNSEDLLNDLNGIVYEAGYSPAFGRFSGTDSVFIVVEFIYPNTPAQDAGLTRGDIIIAINGNDLTTSNYLDLYYGEGPSDLTLGEYLPGQSAIRRTDSVVTVQKAVLDLNPVVHSEYFDVDSRRIGYLFYSRFLNGQNNLWQSSVNAVLSDFKAAGVNELIVDLRYNSGGSIGAAINLANAIVPPAYGTNGSDFIRFEYNDELEQAIITQQGTDSPNLVARFGVNDANLNISRVYFLVSGSSASASELLAIGLQPYMDVNLIGTNTVGKFYGSFVLTGQNETPPNNYAIVPVTLKYANADGFSDFRDGLLPDIQVTENLFQPFPLGDRDDPLLAAALQDITGTVPVAKPYLPRPDYELLSDPVRLKKGNVFRVQK